MILHGREVARMTTKIADSKGRIALGRKFAGQMVIVDDADPNRIIVTPAVAVPAKEAWLFKNDQAMALLRQGLDDARNGRLSKSPPNLKADAALADQIDD